MKGLAEFLAQLHNHLLAALLLHRDARRHCKVINQGAPLAAGRLLHGEVADSKFVHLLLGQHVLLAFADHSFLRLEVDFGGAPTHERVQAVENLWVAQGLPDLWRDLTRFVPVGGVRMFEVGLL